jgi:hypothetical protein
LAVAVISRWGNDIETFVPLDHSRLVAQIRIQAPELLDEWTGLDDVARVNARRHLRNHGVPVPDGAGLAALGPHTICQLNLFAHKAVLALYFEHFRRPLPASGGVCAYWRSKEDFARDGFPPRLVEIFPHYATLSQGGWNVRETFEYRHDQNIQGGLFGCIARLRQGLFVMGFAVTNTDVLTSEVGDWVHPAGPVELLDCSRFRRKN